MERITQLEKFLLTAGIFLLVTGLTSCSDDDVIVVLPSGMIQVDDRVNLTGNILTVQSVIVGQDSWLAAVEIGKEATNNFIAQPVIVEKGTTSNVKLHFDVTAIKYIPGSQEVVLKLYADNQNEGIRGEWDISDKPIALANNVLVIKTITIVADLTNFNVFQFFDINDDGTLDVKEVSRTYPNVFKYWASSKGYITHDGFYSMTFYNTDTDYYDLGISEAEWNEGYSIMYRNWVDDDFSTFDKDQNEFLSDNEWYHIFDESEWFETYDSNSNNQLSEDELNKGFFGEWDLNGDGMIDEDEFNIYWPHVGRWTLGRPM